MTCYGMILISLMMCILPKKEASCVLSAPHKCLLEELLSSYGPEFSRPVKQFNQTVGVQVYMLTNQIIELNEHDQLLKISATMEVSWRDEFLAWNTTQYPDIDKLHIPAKKIWIPDLYMYLQEEVQSDRHDETLALVSPNGNIYWSVQAYFTTSCKINARFFPFDTQNCTLTFASWAYEKGRLDLRIGPHRNERKLYTDNGVWNLTEVHVKSIPLYYDTFNDEIYEFTQIQFTLVLARRPLFYILVIVIPCTLLSLINLVVFIIILPTESGEKVSLGITNFLALILVEQLIGELIPPASDKFPIILYYCFSPMIVTGCLTVISGAITAYFHYHQLPIKVPTWLFKFVKCSRVKTPVKSQKVEKYVSQTINASNIMENSTNYENDEKQEEKIDTTEYVHLNGKEIAVMINKLLMFICVLLTIFSMLTTAILFISS